MEKIKLEYQMDSLMEQSADDNDELLGIVDDNSGGQFFIIGNHDTFTTSVSPLLTQQSKGSRGNQSSGNTTSSGRKRDDRRRATHNEVERRRRDKINNWIRKLANIVEEGTATIEPDGTIRPSIRTPDNQSKGGILSKACEYIQELQESHKEMLGCIKENEQLVKENERLQQEIINLRTHNELLKKQLLSNGLNPVNSPHSSLDS